MTDSNQAVGQALLQAVAGQYPDVNEQLLRTDVDTNVLNGILQEINNDRTQILVDLKQTSRDVAPDVDGWIQQARTLQIDIENAKATARDIVRQAGEATKQREKLDDIERKAQLLRNEVACSERLEIALESIQDVYGRISNAQTAAKQGQLGAALEQLRTIEVRLAELGPIENTSAVDVLIRRAATLRADLVDGVKVQWAQALYANRASRRFTISKNSDGTSLEKLQELSSQLDVLRENINRTCRDLQDIILKPRLDPDRNNQVVKLVIEENAMFSDGERSTQDAISTIEDISSIVHFLHTQLPPCISVELSEILMPPVISRLTQNWLMPAVPTSLEGLFAFSVILESVQVLAQALGKIGWNGSSDLDEWVEQGPRIWLSKRKESALDAVRHALAIQVQSTKTVERVETQIVAKDDVIHGPNGAGDDWDAWAEEEEDKPALPERPSVPVPVAQAEEDDWGAWGGEDNAANEAEDVETQAPSNSVNEDDDDDESSAWGWDDPANAEPESNAKSPTSAQPDQVRATQPASTERELTLKETYTATEVSSTLVTLITTLVTDATALLDSTSSFSSSPIAPAAAGIYGIPTLLLACFRALAPTYYTPLPSGLMYLYNDCLHLTTLLQTLHTTLQHSDATSPTTSTLSQSAWPSSRLALPTSISTLTTFGARAYARELDAQRTIIRDLLDGASGFTNCTEAPFRRDCENAVSMACDRVRDVAKLWTPVLSRSALVQSLGSLVAAITGKLCVEIEDLPDISEEESQVLRGLCDHVGKLADLFVPEQQSPLQTSMSPTLVHIYAPGWFKFQYLSEILVSSLADMKYLWSEGELALEFEADEVVLLVEALFAETEHRRRAISEIRRRRV